MSFWVAGATTVASVATSVYSGNQAAKGAAKQAGAASKAENDAIAKQNLDSIVRNSYKTGMQNLQLGLQKQQLAQAGFDATTQVQQAYGAASSNAAAAGAVGSSVDAVLNDIDSKGAEARIQTEQNLEAVLTNYNNELEAQRTGMEQGAIGARKYEYTGPSAGQIWTGALLQGAMSFGSSYFGAKMNLGMGASPGYSAQPTVMGSPLT